MTEIPPTVATGAVVIVTGLVVGWRWSRAGMVGERARRINIATGGFMVATGVSWIVGEIMSWDDSGLTRALIWCFLATHAAGSVITTRRLNDIERAATDPQ